MSTPTPRTDAKLLTVAQRTSPTYLPEMVWADFARELERELADQAARFHDEIVSRQGTVRANQELDLKERDQLRAEVNEAHAATHHWCNRAELAEAALADAQPKSDHYMSTWLERAAARAEKAEAEAERYRLVTLKQDAELATERARLDWLLEDNVTRFENSCFDRADIDNDMKEGAK